MRRFFILWASLLVPLQAYTQTVYISHCLGDCPELSHPQNEIIIRHLYAAAIDQDSGLAEWVAFRVLADSVGVASLLPRWWQQDNLSQTGVSSVQDDDGPGFEQPDLSDAQDREYRVNEISFAADDRGRLTPVSSFAGTPYWDELNYLSNMSPLPIALRMGSWSRLDSAINELAQESGELHVISGPLYSFQAGGDSGEYLGPSSYFKVITDGESIAAFVFDKDLPVHAHHCDQLSSLQLIENRIDRRLFPSYSNLEAGNWAEKLGCSR